ncbi:unnamed protein product [Acanthoscelides obtectus]|uniref:Uncharacterized protein n=1 Tax=Acanthoscelides obtectus TaxID=200917 RepID=A0A9P0P8B1_ACAOB|nr:unnamed protein product [Acanthoscelides obtectus]CAK1625656.1 hypothetical protein AOBTE_LOCUS3313 [Acanthoscelides obtectus]
MPIAVNIKDKPSLENIQQWFRNIENIRRSRLKNPAIQQVAG